MINIVTFAKLTVVSVRPHEVVSLELRDVFDLNVSWIANDAIEAAVTHGLPEACHVGIPIKRVDPVALGVAEESALVVNVRPDEGIAADDVVLERGEKMLLGWELRPLAFEGLEVEAHHGNLDRLGVNIHAEKIALENYYLAINREAMAAIRVFVDFPHEFELRAFSRSLNLGMIKKPADMVINQALKSADEE